MNATDLPYSRYNDGHERKESHRMHRMRSHSNSANGRIYKKGFLMITYFTKDFTYKLLIAPPSQS